VPPTWRRLLPETRALVDAPWLRDDGWLIKSAYSNTGATSAIPEFSDGKQMVEGIDELSRASAATSPPSARKLRAPRSMRLQGRFSFGPEARP